MEDPDEPIVKPTKEEEEDDKFKTFAIVGKDATGARGAYDTLEGSNIEDTLGKYHRILDDDKKRKEYEQYAMYNLDLFLIKWEGKLAASLGQEPACTEPVVPKPEGAVIRDPEAAAAAGEAPEAGEEIGAEEEALPELPPPGV